MAIYLGNIEISDASLGSNQIGEIWFGDTQIYPSSITYVITAISLYYSAGNTIYANALNYAYAKGTVQAYKGTRPYGDPFEADLTPYSLGDTTNFNISGNHITANHLHTTETDGFATTVDWRYQSSAPVRSANVTQEANIKGEDYIHSASVALNTNNIRCNENSVSISGQTTRTIWADFTSGEHSERTDHNGNIDVYYEGLVIGTITGQSPVVTKTVGYNYHNTLERDFDFRGKYSTYYSSWVTSTQGADSIIGTYPEAISGSYWASLSYTGSISASGGSATLSSYAGHQYRNRYDWQYGEDTYSGAIDTSDGSTIVTSSSSSRISRSGTSVTHSSMGSDETTDSATYYCYNNSSSSVRDYVILSATNRKETGQNNTYTDPAQQGTQYYRYQYTASISASNYVSNLCPASGGSCTLTWEAKYKQNLITPWSQHYTVRYEGSYTSGTPYSDFVREGTNTWETEGGWSDWITESVTPEIYAPSGGFTRSGSSVTIASEAKTSYPDGRYATFSLSYHGYYPSVTVRQQENTLTYGQWNWIGDAFVVDSQTQNYTASLIVNDYTSSSSPAPYGGGSTSFTASGSHEQKDEWQRNKYRINTWTSLETDREDSYDTWWDSSWSTRIDTPTVNVIAGASSWITISGNTLVISANSGSARNGTIQANNGSAFDSKIIYQAQYVAQINMIVSVNGAPVQPGIINDWYPITVTASIDVKSASAISIPIEGLIITKTDSTVEELTNQYHSGTITIAAGEYSGSIQFSPSFRYKRTFSNGEKVKAKCSKPQGIATLSTPEVTVTVS